MERANQQYGQQLLWPQVGQAFIDLCLRAQTVSPHPVASRLLPVSARKVSLLS
jgi:hypothetical protein